jgi:hypothetical protein
LDQRSASSVDLFPTPASQWHLARRSVVVTNYPMAGFAAAGLDGHVAEFVVDTGLLNCTRDILVSDPDTTAFDPEHPDKLTFNYGAFISDGQRLSGTPSLEVFLARSELDPAPPANQAGRLGPYFLPNCASLKVEWALPISRLPDPAGILVGAPTIWVDPYRDSPTGTGVPEDPPWFALMERYLNEAQAKYMNRYPAVLQKWVDFWSDCSTQGGNRNLYLPTHEFFTVDPNDVQSEEPDPLFPEALRVTVDVFDDVGRLERPIRHVMVIPIGT